MSRRNRKRRNRSNNQPAVQRADVVESRTEKMTIASWKGPLPPPNQLQLYDNLVPGAASRILNMAETQSEHRIQMERTVISGDSKRSYWGLVAAFTLSVMIILGGIYVMVAIHPWAGTTLIGMNIVGLAGVFVYGTNSRRMEREQKDDRMPRRRS